MKGQIIAEFKSYLKHLGYSEAIQRMLPRLLTEFLNNITKTVENIEAIDILNYYQYITNRPIKRGFGTLSESSISHHIYTLKVFFSWQIETGEISTNPMSTLTFPRPKSKPREILTQEEIIEMFEKCIFYRERVVLCLCYGLGLRRSEAVKMDVNDINFKTSLAYVREGKGKKRRVIPMNDAISSYLKIYLESERTSTKTTALITTKLGNRATGGNLNNTLKEVLERAGIEKTISLHCLRHSIATHLIQNGLSVEYVRDFLGHKHLESTQIYTRIKNNQLWNLR
jgi:integrase/recombinase XerD